MKRRTRIQYTDRHKAQMWDRRRQGELLHQIARLFDRHHSSVRGVLAPFHKPIERYQQFVALTS